MVELLPVLVVCRHANVERASAALNELNEAVEQVQEELAKEPNRRLDTRPLVALRNALTALRDDTSALELSIAFAQTRITHFKAKHAFGAHDSSLAAASASASFIPADDDEEESQSRS